MDETPIYPDRSGAANRSEPDGDKRTPIPEPNSPGQKPDDPMVAHTATMVRWTRVTAGAAVVSALAALVSAGVAGVTAGIYFRQLREMQTGGADTHSLALAAGSQSKSMESLATATRDELASIRAAASAARDQATQLERLSQDTANQARATASLAINSGEQISAIKEQSAATLATAHVTDVAFKEGNRPILYLTIDNIQAQGNVVGYLVSISNGGNRPAFLERAFISAIHDQRIPVSVYDRGQLGDDCVGVEDRTIGTNEKLSFWCTFKTQPGEADLILKQDRALYITALYTYHGVTDVRWGGARAFYFIPGVFSGQTKSFVPMKSYGTTSDKRVADDELYPQPDGKKNCGPTGSRDGILMRLADPGRPCLETLPSAPESPVQAR